MEWYTKVLVKTAALTTDSLRNGLSKHTWIEQHGQHLKDLKVKYIEAEGLKENGEGTDATVTGKVRLFVVIEEVPQVEWCTLKNVDGAWLIDGRDSQDERLIGERVKL